MPRFGPAAESALGPGFRLGTRYTALRPAHATGKGPLVSATVYAPGSAAHDLGWRLLATDRVLGAFGPGTTVHTMADLWRVANDGAPIDALIDAIPVRGRNAIASFALAVFAGGSTTIVARGGACADVVAGRQVHRIDSRGREPWSVVELGGVTQLALGPVERAPGDVEPGPRDLPVENAVVVGSSLTWAATDIRPAAAGGGSRPGRRAAVPATPIADEPLPSRRAARAAAAATEFPPPIAGRTPPPGAGYGAQPGDTVGYDDLGRMGALRQRADEPPATAPTPETEAAASFRIGHGMPQRVDTPVYVGRQPRSPRVTGATMPRLVRVDSPTLEVSATHVELRPGPKGVVLTDLRSTNGTVVREPGRGVRRLEPGESVPVSPGTLVDIGDGNVIEILPWR